MNPRNPPPPRHQRAAEDHKRHHGKMKRHDQIRQRTVFHEILAP